MKIRPLSHLPVGVVLCFGMLTAGASAQIAENLHPYRIFDDPVIELSQSHWDRVSPYQDGLPSLPMGHDTTLLSGGGLPQDTPRIFEHLKSQIRNEDDFRDWVLGLKEDVEMAGSKDQRDKEWKKAEPKSPRNHKEKYHDPEGPPGPRNPEAHPDRPMPEHGEGRGKPEELQRRLHQLEKELEASRRREAALRVVVKDLIDQMPSHPPAKTFTPPLPPPPASAAGGSPSQLYLQGHLTMSDGMGLELRNDYVGAYNRFKEARDLFDAAFAADPEWEPEIVKFRREKIRQEMERVRILEFQHRRKEAPLFRQKGQDGLKKQSGEPDSPAEGPHARPEGLPPPPPPHAPPHAPQEH